MRFDALNQWMPRLAALGLATAAGASMAYWVLRWPSVNPSAWRDTPVAALEGAPVALDAPALTRLLGGGSAPTEIASAPAGGRWRLVGVVASASGQGAALIAEDDQPARSYRVGSRVGDQLVLQSVAHRRAMLAPSLEAPVTLTLEVPELAPDAQRPAAAMPSAPAELGQEAPGQPPGAAPVAAARVPPAGLTRPPRVKPGR